MWVARRDADTDQLAELLEQCRDEGVAASDEIAAKHAAPNGLTTEDLHRYFTENLHYTLGDRENQGLAKFQQHCQSLGLIDQHSTSQN